MTDTGYPLAVDVWNTGQTFTGSSLRMVGLDRSLQFRDAHRVDTVDLQGRPWTVWWTRSTWDAKAGHFSVLSVLCVQGASAAAGRLAA
jgi:hypothetical protein